MKTKKCQNIKIYCHHVNCGQISLSFLQNEFRPFAFYGGKNKNILTNPKKTKGNKNLQHVCWLLRPEITVNKAI